MGTKFWPVPLIFLLLLAFVGFWFVLATRAARTIKANRTEIVYELQFPESQAISDSAKRTLQDETIRIVGHRLQNYAGHYGFSVLREGDSAISVQFPKRLRLVEVKSLLETEGRIQLLWAKNLVTEKNASRRFKLETLSDKKRPLEISFLDQFDSSGKPFDRTDPRYQALLKGWVPILESEEIQDCKPYESGASTVPGISFTPSGAKKLEAWCRKYISECENLAFVIDGKVISVAPLQEGAIISDRAVITGRFTKENVTKLCAMIGAGRLPVKLVERAKPGK